MSLKDYMEKNARKIAATIALMAATFGGNKAQAQQLEQTNNDKKINKTEHVVHMDEAPKKGLPESEIYYQEDGQQDISQQQDISKAIRGSFKTHFGNIEYELKGSKISFDGDISPGQMGHFKPRITVNKENKYCCGDREFQDLAIADRYAKVVERGVQQTYILGLIARNMQECGHSNTPEYENINKIYQENAAQYGIEIVTNENGNPELKYNKDSKFVPPSTNEKGTPSILTSLYNNYKQK